MSAHRGSIRQSRASWPLPRVSLSPTLTLLFVAVLLAGVPLQSADARADVWRDVAVTGIQKSGARPSQAVDERTLRLDLAGLDDLLASAPSEFSGKASAAPVLSLPLPNGDMGRFRIVASPIMAPELAARYPEIQTYAGISLDDPHATARLDRTPHGFHAIILSSRSSGTGTVYIDPYQRGDTQHYVSYWRRDAVRLGARAPIELPPRGYDAPVNREARRLLAQGLVTQTGPLLRTYRLAVATTGEYTQFHGGTVPDGLAAVVTAMNRINGIYEREASLRMELVANNDQIIYTDGGTDPYTNDDGDALLGENQTNVDNVIGSGNYDVGHVFSTGGGGVAELGSVCDNGRKAQGVTGSGSPTGDPFWVDFVAHELGHQWGGTHTFNATTGNCDGNGNPATAYEPGSGTTIMGYAGICAPQDIQPNSNDYFHSASFDQYVAHIAAIGACGTSAATGNSPPVPNAGASGFAIPRSTPFELTGSATDADGDTLSYCWEQWDLGPAGHPNTPTGDAPLFRSFSPVASPTRVFPQLSDLLNNTQTMGELLPTYSRNMTFRLTARDNKGGVAHDQMSFTVTDAAGPFLVTAPNTAVTWTGGANETVTWDVASTTGAPVNAANVDILLSTDGGNTFPTVVLANTPNDGSQLIVVPNLPTTQARIKVKAAANLFFDISNTNFTILDGGGGTCSISDLAAGTQTACDGGSNTYTQEVIVTYTNPPGSGTLDVAGQSFAITTSPQTVTLINLTADGNPVNVTAAFSDAAACSLTENALFTAPAACGGGGNCGITDLAAGTQTPCNIVTNQYTQEVIVTYVNPPATGFLNVGSQQFAITGSPQTVTLTALNADGNPVDVTAAFSDSLACSRTENALFTAPANCGDCSITDLTAGRRVSCEGATYRQEVIVTYAGPAPVGGLNVNGQLFAVTGSPQTVVLAGLAVDGNPVNVTATFPNEPACTRTENGLFTAPTSCNTAPAQTCMTSNPINIPDDDGGGISDNITVNDSVQITNVRVFVDIEHTWIGDLIIEVEHNGTTVRLHNLSGNDTEDRIGWYPTDFAVDGPGSLADFNGQMSHGTWTLTVSDNEEFETGTLFNWCVEVTGTQMATNVGDDADLPQVATLYGNHPNPAPRGVTDIRFALPARATVGVRIFDVSGRLVRTLHGAPLDRGHHTVHWNGRDERGNRVPSGIYFSRVTTTDAQLMRKIVVVR